MAVITISGRSTELSALCQGALDGLERSKESDRFNRSTTWKRVIVTVVRASAQPRDPRPRCQFASWTFSPLMMMRLRAVSARTAKVFFGSM